MRPNENKTHCDVIDCGNITRRLGHPYETPKPEESKNEFAGLRCPHCESTFVKLLETKAIKVAEGFEVIKKYQCRTCSGKFSRVVESQVTICEECDAAIHKAETKISKTEESINFISVCPQCGHENPYRSVPLVDTELELYSEDKTLDLAAVAQEIAIVLAEYFSPTSTQIAVLRLSEVLQIKNNPLKARILKSIYDMVIAKKIVLEHIESEIKKQSLQEYDLTLLSDEELMKLYTTNSIENVIVAGNEIYHRTRPGFGAAKNRVVQIVQVFESCSINQNRLVKSTRTKIHGMMDKGHKFSSLLYFIDWLESAE